MHLSSAVALAAVRSKAAVLLLFTFCLLLLPLWESVIVICFVVHYLMPLLVLTGKRELVALLCLSSWCLVIVVWLFLAVLWVCLQFVIVVFPDHTHLLFGRGVPMIRDLIWPTYCMPQSFSSQDKT